MSSAEERTTEPQASWVSALALAGSLYDQMFGGIPQVVSEEGVVEGGTEASRDDGVVQKPH
eukprot:6462001-Pyramimonas_sp.AAC.1